MPNASDRAKLLEASPVSSPHGQRVGLPRALLLSPAPSAVYGWLFWHRGFGVIIRVGFVPAFEGEKLWQRNSGKIPS